MVLVVCVTFTVILFYEIVQCTMKEKTCLADKPARGSLKSQDCHSLPLASNPPYLKQKEHNKCVLFVLAAEEGFEPSQNESESLVLPLHYSAILN